ncbi:mRNA transport regulator MTR2 [Candida viswanathii]|uniref:mRNA transport regulator MTR2 n=1 Tax=Candida viswanathii TaxID=5486 RepID=A0A367YM26_9ASCO|nr:mRNA transport regulator MTR2 [Candida viswanathii]
MNQDPTQKIELFLKNFLASLDTQYTPTPASNIEQYALQLGSPLKRTSSIIVNGNPIIPSLQEDSKLQFQKKWLLTPLSFHQLTSFDAHLIPGTGLFVVHFAAKVKFDQLGKNRLGESADLVHAQESIVNNGLNKGQRSVWGSWFGVDCNLIIDENFNESGLGEFINSLDYRFTYIPQDSIIKV